MAAATRLLEVGQEDELLFQEALDLMQTIQSLIIIQAQPLGLVSALTVDADRDVAFQMKAY